MNKLSWHSFERVRMLTSILTLNLSDLLIVKMQAHKLI